MEFYGRIQEQRKLRHFFEDDRSSAALVYGRRRVGKSALIKQSIKNENIRKLYYECKQTSEQNNVDSLSALISEEFQLPVLGFTSMEVVLKYLFETSINERIILVIDEYPYLRETVKGLDSILQSLLDQYRDHSHLKLILCGSYVETMKYLLAKENPLFGRIDLVIDLKPMDYYESAMFYPNFSPEDKVKLYSVFGGIPYYNRWIDSSYTVKENIQELISAPGSRLENEVSMYLKAEISKIVNANEVFEALSRGFSKYNDLLSQSHVSSGPTLIDVLDKLIRMEIVEKYAPINDKNNRRKSGYVIIDQMSLFYYRYIFRFLSQRSILDEDIFYKRYIQENFETQYVPKVFETVCKQYLIRQNRAGNITPAFDDIGKYYYDDPAAHKNGEFDIVTRDPDGYIFYEAKFQNHPLSAEEISKEMIQVKAAGLNCYKFGFISKSGYQCKPDNDQIFIRIEDLYR